MTDAPKTLPLNSRQWRVLLNDHLEVMKGAVSQTEVIDETALRNIYKHLDEMKMQATAWFQVSAPAVVPADAEGATQDASAEAPAKRRGGWTKGKPRKDRAGTQAVQ